MNNQMHAQKSSTLGDTRCVRCTPEGLLMAANPLAPSILFTSGSGVAYTAGDSVGVATALTVLDSGVLDQLQGVRLDSVTLVDADNQKQPLVLLFFQSASGLTATDNAPFALGALGWSNLVGKIDIAAADYTVVDTAAVVSVSNLGLALHLGSAVGATDLTVVAMTKGTPTYTAGKGLKCHFGITR